MSDHVIVTDIARADASTVEALAEFGAATVHEAMGRIGYAGPRIRPIQQGTAISGSAVTVLAAPGDNLLIHAAIEQAQPGDVIVVVPKAESPYGYIGDLMVTQMHARGVRGYVTTGGVRDTAELREMGFPVWTAHVSAEGTVKDTPGSVNVPVVLDGVVVHPGDVVVADDDGVTIVPRERADAALDASRRRVAKEAGDREAYAGSELSMDRKGLRSVIADLGIRTLTQAEYEAERRGAATPS
ncbi:4-carboxy-4-hydroxy-2-oxoadipate aldolase/oxaloacetate decarboxylase [Pseudoclavibacter endophyticus]|uniref:Putative 4-hydroxy-4-methyl-2-oxoglutarate aldolase n=1 Tax=Pseudoclavibacter endophyticus TaxID=1778590 RepID=A0A6H9WJZ7_9MICO|nr:4-carboxy-4-hydroxy-2-oxoadipate aldolase/oxaloacetate decarboxylase [Pseudoclavibacter endophyticus]KAB1648049.1 4-carboxy-4-hydroxy-2-oxoadipate aldolase/oxaloacetate decarboxylase [Pseudoclavibacter endophyticus]GGA69286.1 4-carboxy-4-hydroxy-2-oxoadipate aldolase/oxaloacetate decarboxylase [Pseudoclavibacter endophyticus]